MIPAPCHGLRTRGWAGPGWWGQYFWGSVLLFGVTAAFWGQFVVAVPKRSPMWGCVSSSSSGEFRSGEMGIELWDHLCHCHPHPWDVPSPVGTPAVESPPVVPIPGNLLALERMWSHHPETQTLPAQKIKAPAFFVGFCGLFVGFFGVFLRGIFLLFPLNASGFLQPHVL